ncbi:hypothetical protein KY290_008948 [Solanum tuberosum]|uniref:Uncharacterized protein n=1 Tax=Solanum tuberosum TaxID=4113 RepID=A0ABQ7W9Z7_SOLTU|nr:hypothetical protein KY290_008948 [Solanum tuberosum]
MHLRIPSLRAVGLFSSLDVLSNMLPVKLKNCCLARHFSEDDLLCTGAPLPLLSSGFGIHLSSLNKLSASNCSFMLSGYISGGIHLSSLNKLSASNCSFKLSGYISGPDVYTVECGDGLFSVERPSVKMKLVNIWNTKLQAQGECTSTRDGKSKEDKLFLT